MPACLFLNSRSALIFHNFMSTREEACHCFGGTASSVTSSHSSSSFHMGSSTMGSSTTDSSSCLGSNLGSTFSSFPATSGFGLELSSSIRASRLNLCSFRPSWILFIAPQTVHTWRLTCMTSSGMTLHETTEPHISPHEPGMKSKWYGIESTWHDHGMAWRVAWHDIAPGMTWHGMEWNYIYGMKLHDMRWVDFQPRLLVQSRTGGSSSNSLRVRDIEFWTIFKVGGGALHLTMQGCFHDET